MGYLQFSTSNSGGTVIERMRIDSSGNVGIGTSSPSYRLEVKGASATAGQLSIHDGTGDTTVSGVTAGSLLFQARDSSIRTIAEIDAVNTTTNGTGGAMVFQTRISDALAERMRIDSSGNVWIGTTANNVFDQVGGARPLVVQKADTNTTVNGSTASVTITNADTTTNNTAQLNFAAITGASTNQYSSAVISCIFGARTNGQYPTGQLTFSTSTTLNAAPTEKMRIDSSGNLLVGVTAAYGTSSAGNTHIAGGSSQQLFLRHTAATAGKYWKLGPDNGANNMTVMNNSGAGVYMTDGANTWSSTSDERLKTDLIPIENGLDKVNSLRSVTGRFKTDEVGISRSFLIAQDLQAVLPEAVSVQDSRLGTLGIAYTDVIPLLVASIKELKAIIDTQQEQINSLLGK